MKPLSASQVFTSSSYSLLNVSTSLASTNNVAWKLSVTTEYWYKPCSPNEGGPSFTTQSVERSEHCFKQTHLCLCAANLIGEHLKQINFTSTLRGRVRNSLSKDVYLSAAS